MRNGSNGVVYSCLTQQQAWVYLQGLGNSLESGDADVVCHIAVDGWESYAHTVGQLLQGYALLGAHPPDAGVTLWVLSCAAHS